MRTEEIVLYGIIAFVVYQIVSKSNQPTVTVIPPNEPLQTGINPSDLVPIPLPSFAS